MFLKLVLRRNHLHAFCQAVQVAATRSEHSSFKLECNNRFQTHIAYRYNNVTRQSTHVVPEGG